MVPPMVWDQVMPAWSQWKEGRDPDPGGALDQPHWYTVLVPIFEAGIAKEQAIKDKTKGGG